MKIKFKTKLMGGPTYYLMLALATIDDTLDLVATLLAISAPILSTVFAALAGASIVGGTARKVMCYYDWSCYVFGGTAETAGAIVGGVAGGVAGVYTAPIAGPVIGFLFLGGSLLISIFIGLTLIIFYFWNRVSFTSKKLAVIGIAAVTEMTPIISAIAPATILSLLYIRHNHNKEQKATAKKKVKLAQTRFSKNAEGVNKKFTKNAEVT